MLAGHSFSWSEIENGPYAWFIPSPCGNSSADSPINVNLLGCSWEDQLYSIYDSVPVIPCDGTYDSCCVCNGPGEVYECGCSDIPEGECDCEGNELDALGECGGACASDADSDGICDDVDDCIGSYDACGVCNGPGEIYDCGCSDIPEGECDCEGNELDALGECGGACASDADSDGICDDVDDCIGSYDACGVCNGPGEIYECGCSDIPEGQSDCGEGTDDDLDDLSDTDDLPERYG